MSNNETEIWPPATDAPPPAAHFILAARQLAQILGYPTVHAHLVRMWVEPEGGYLHVLLTDPEITQRPTAQWGPYRLVAEGGYVDIARGRETFWGQFELVIRQTKAAPDQHIWELHHRGQGIVATGAEVGGGVDHVTAIATRLFPLVEHLRWET